MRMQTTEIWTSDNYNSDFHVFRFQISKTRHLKIGKIWIQIFRLSDVMFLKFENLKIWIHIFKFLNFWFLKFENLKIWKIWIQIFRFSDFRFQKLETWKYEFIFLNIFRSLKHGIWRSGNSNSDFHVFRFQFPEN